MGVCEVALEHAFASGIITEAVDSVVSWELALEQNVSDLDRLWQAVFARFASVVCLLALFEQDCFGFASWRRSCERFLVGCAGGVKEELADAANGAGGMLIRGIAIERKR